MNASTLFSTGVFINASSEFSSLVTCGVHQQHICHRSIVNDVLAECQASALQKIDGLLVMENKAPFTLHEPYLMDCREKFLKSYRDARAPILRGGNYQLKPEELIARDPLDQALRYMAIARAYFHGLH